LLPSRWLLAGTIGAKNQGKGIVGVAPGIGIYALRVLHADGNGLLSDLLRAYDHLVANARQLGIRVVNLSLSGVGQSTDEDCHYVTELVNQGITVITAAGENMLQFLSRLPHKAVWHGLATAAATARSKPFLVTAGTHATRTQPS
jgi:hypothetical protein